MYMHLNKFILLETFDLVKIYTFICNKYTYSRLTKFYSVIKMSVDFFIFFI